MNKQRIAAAVVIGGVVFALLGGCAGSVGGVGAQGPETGRESFESASAVEQPTPGAAAGVTEGEASEHVYGMPPALVDRTDSVGVELAGAWKAVLERAWQSDQAISFAFDYDPDIEAIVVDIDDRVPQVDVDSLRSISDLIHVNMTAGGAVRLPLVTGE